MLLREPLPIKQRLSKHEHGLEQHQSECVQCCVSVCVVDESIQFVVAAVVFFQHDDARKKVVQKQSGRTVSDGDIGVAGCGGDQ